MVAPETRAALWLHLVEGQTLRQVGACLGMARSTLSDRIQGGIEELRSFLRVEKEGLVTSIQELDLTGRRSYPEQRIVLEETGGRGTVRFQVLDAVTGKPVHWAAVAVDYRQGDDFVPLAFGARKDEGERIEIAGLPAGRYRALVTEGSGELSLHEAKVVEFEHRPGADQDLETRLAPGGGLALSLTSPGGLVPGWFSAQVFGPDGTPVPLERQGAMETTRRFRGAIMLSSLPAGECRVRVTAEAGEPVEKTILVEPGKTTSLLVEHPGEKQP